MAIENDCRFWIKRRNPVKCLALDATYSGWLGEVASLIQELIFLRSLQGVRHFICSNKYPFT